MNLYLSTSKAVSLPSYSSLKAVNRLRSTFRILARSPMLLSKARNRAQTSLQRAWETKKEQISSEIWINISLTDMRATWINNSALPWLFWWQASWGEDTFKQNPSVVILWRDTWQMKKRREQGYTLIFHYYDYNGREIFHFLNIWHQDITAYINGLVVKNSFPTFCASALYFITHNLPLRCER